MGKHARIYVQAASGLYDFMWAYQASDGSVMMGFTFEGETEVKLILDPDLGELRPVQFHAPSSVERMKISFHASGQYKLSARMGEDGSNIDRVGVVGPRLSEIVQPRLMAEILLPARLPPATGSLSLNDIAISIAGNREEPLRAAVSCMSNDCFEKLTKDGSRIVQGSIWESNHALTNGCQAWVWTIRRLPDDELFPDGYLVFLPGFPRWGSLSQIGNTKVTAKPL